jgi:hypothetical protein
MITEHLEDIYLSNNLIIFYFPSRRIRIWNYNIHELKQFLQHILDKYTYDIGIVTSYRNLKLVYSTYYTYVNGIPIENLLTNRDENIENDTITLDSNKFRFYAYSPLFQELYSLLGTNVRKRLAKYRDFNFRLF